ncbi:MAG: Rieske 2Fe-2S domain-containing protein [Mycobacteriales bacterium]
MRITCTGHAGLFIETRGGTILTDPWVNPAYFASWFPFPDNSGLDWDRLGRCDYLYLSHLHRDHLDVETLRRHVNKDAVVLLPDFPTDEMHDWLAALGFHRFVEMPDSEPVEFDGGLRMMITALTSPTDGPIGDSGLTVDDGTAVIFDQNDSRPPILDAITGFAPGGYDAHFLQFSGAIWWPWVYELPEKAKLAFGRAKRVNGLARAKRYVDAVAAKHVVPHAGPPAFLDDPLLPYNDTSADASNTFPDHPVFLDYLRGGGRESDLLMIPGSVLTLEGGKAEVAHPVPDSEVAAIFEDKAGYLKAYAERRRAEIEAERASWARPGLDLVAELKMWFEPLLALAERIGAGVGGPVLLNVVTPGDAPGAIPSVDAPVDLPIVIDFPAATVRLLEAGDKPRYTFWVERPLLEKLVAEHEIDWVNSLFLSMRFRASRIGQYNEYVYTFFKCLSPERLEYAEGWYAEQEGVVEEVQLGDWIVQRRCPHLKADLTRFGEISDGVLHCSMHGWNFDLASGRCLTATGHTLHSRPAARAAASTAASEEADDPG